MFPVGPNRAIHGSSRAPGCEHVCEWVNERLCEVVCALLRCRKQLEQMRPIYNLVYRGPTKDTCHPVMLKQVKHRQCNVMFLCLPELGLMPGQQLLQTLRYWTLCHLKQSLCSPKCREGQRIRSVAYIGWGKEKILINDHMGYYS